MDADMTKQLEFFLNCMYIPHRLCVDIICSDLIYHLQKLISYFQWTLYLTRTITK